MKLVSYWRTATKRNSVRMLIAHMLIAFVGAMWAALPGSLIDRMPLWMVLLISGLIAAIGLGCAYTKQPSLEENHVDAE